MATKKYVIKYRKLKAIYEELSGKRIADVTWYRLVADMKRYLDFSVESPQAELTVRWVADLKAKYRKFSFTSDKFSEGLDLFQKYRNRDYVFGCEEFFLDLLHCLGVEESEVPRSTKYHWFQRSGVSYGVDKRYKSKDLALVALAAARWVLNKREEKAKQEKNKQEISSI